MLCHCCLLIMESYPRLVPRQALSTLALEAALRSDHLNVVTENFTFTLVESWCDAQVAKGVARGEVLAAFKRLASSLRFASMSRDFLGMVVAGSPWMVEAGDISCAVIKVLSQRGSGASVHANQRIRDRFKRTYTFGSCPNLRLAFFQKFPPTDREIAMLMPLRVTCGYFVEAVFENRDEATMTVSLNAPQVVSPEDGGSFHFRTSEVPAYQCRATFELGKETYPEAKALLTGVGGWTPFFTFPRPKVEDFNAEGLLPMGCTLRINPEQ